MAGLLRVATAGSVDDGKSTLVGRLLYDSRSVLADQLAAVQEASVRKGHDHADLALLTDGLRAEREQGITIDVAYRYFATARRSFVLADTPGHVEYTRNMATGASTADVAVVLVDVRQGLTGQSRRHAAIAAVMGVPHLVLAVNKMDLVDYDESTFDAVSCEFAELADQLAVRSFTALPVSALHGDNVVERSANTAWYDGPALLEHLETVQPTTPRPTGLRLPVQLVLRPGQGPYADFRGYAGRIAAGEVRPGDPVLVLPAGRTSRVLAVQTADGPLAVAGTGRSVVVRLADALDVGRGDLLVDPRDPPTVSRDVSATVCVLADDPLAAGRRVRVRHGTADVPAVLAAVTGRLQLDPVARVAATALSAGDLGSVRLRAADPLPVDPYARSRRTGCLLLVDEATGAALAAGMVEEAPR